MEGVTAAALTALIPRPRLEALLTAAMQKPLAVVAAAAGFGKSLAVAKALADTDYRTVWLTFTALDNSPARFWENLTATFALHRPALAAQMEALGFPDSEHAFEAFLAELTAELYRDERAVVFVFDDVHLVGAPWVIEFLTALVEARLENSCIVIITRVWPLPGREIPVPTALIGTDELRFTDDEAARLFAAAGLQLSGESVVGLNRYVAGWPLALSLLALTIGREGAAGEAALTTDQAVLAAGKPQLFVLFEREIFSQYTPPEQTLLILLSVLESFPRGLVQAVSGEQGRELGQLLGGNIFIRYDADARRFYFHALYQEFLREKLPGLEQSLIDDSYRKAAAWCRENGHHYDAVNYYRQSGDVQLVWDTLLQFVTNRHTQAEAEFVIEQLAWLPEDFKAQRPMAGVLEAVMLVNNLRFDEAVQALDEVQAHLAGQPPSPTLGEYHAARGLVALGMGQGDLAGSFRLANELLPAGSSHWGRGLRMVDLGPALPLQSSKAGALKKSLAAYTEGVPAMVRVLHGAGQGLDKLCQCEALFLTGEARAATEPAYQALYVGQAGAQWDIIGNALFMLLRIYTVLGDYQSIRDTMEHVHRYQLDEAAAPLGIWDIAWGWFYSELGEVDRVAAWVRNAVQYGYAPVGIERPVLVRLRCLIAEGQYPEALALAQQSEVLARSKNAVVLQLYVELYRAVTYNYRGEHAPALASLKAAYTLARGNKLVMPFIEYGNRTRSLLERARSGGGHGIPAAWLDEVHAKASTYAKRHAALAGRYRQARQASRPDFGLSRREVELLEQLSQGLTREEIAESMQLSLNTVKSMLKLVFSKLGAINSADAIRIAIGSKII